jgi:hypothetical protein
MLNYVEHVCGRCWTMSMLNLICCRCWTMNIDWLSCNCFDYLVITPLCFDYLVRVAIFSTLGQRWLASTRSYKRFASPLSCTTPPPSHHVGESFSRRHTAPPSCMQEVESFSHRRTAPPPSSDLDDSVEMWVAASPPLCLQVAPPPPTRLVLPRPLIQIWECPHVKEVSSYERCF